MLAHPSVQVLGHRTDVPELMRNSDILVLPSIEEGSALVTSEARGQRLRPAGLGRGRRDLQATWKMLWCTGRGDASHARATHHSAA